MKGRLTVIGSARNLKLGGARGKGQGTRGKNFLCVAQMSTLFSCCVHGKDVAGSRGRALDQGVRGRSPPEAKTLLTFGRAMKAANKPAV